MDRSNKITVRLTYRQILKTWWPLAFSWILMSVEIPAISAVVARLADPKINLAAFGSVVYPIALLIESPIVMLLGASTALSRHRQAYQRGWRFMMIACAVLTGLHILIVYTPLYYSVVGGLMGEPKEIIEPARLGLMIMVPWTWAIGYRRFQQGVMIRYGYSEAVGIGTLVRLSADALVLVTSYLIHSIPGVAVAAMAQILGVLSEAAYAGWRVRPILRNELNRMPEDSILTWAQFYNFYIPLALTSLISLAWQPVGSSMLSRMPEALNSLAAWPVVTGLVSILRSFGVAYNEVVIALLERDRSFPALRRFAHWMAAAVTGLTLLFCATPLDQFYFGQLMALPPALLPLAKTAIWLSLPAAGMAVFQNWFQGMILYGKQTRGVPESVFIFFASLLLGLLVGVIWKPLPGLYVGMITYSFANFTQMMWLLKRSRPVARRIHETG